MRRWALLPVLMLSICLGCASNMNSNLLQARVREQALQLTESEREVAQTRADLNRSRLEIERMRSELASLKRESADDEIVQVAASKSEMASQVDKLHIYAMASGGLNRDNRPGDDAVAVQFAPMDRAGNPIKAAGDLEIVLIDPMLPDGDREIGRWDFSAEQCQSQWTRGVTGAGYQFTVPLDPPADHANLVVQLRYTASGGREFRASRIVRVVVAGDETKIARRPPRMQAEKVARSEEYTIEDVPPAGIDSEDESSSEFSENDLEELDAPREKRERVQRDSTNWTDASIPVIR